jgi:hypothetical protein
MKWLIRIAGAAVALIVIAIAGIASLDVNQDKHQLVDFVE